MLSADLFLDCVLILLHDNSTRYQKLIQELIGIYEEEAKTKEGSDAELIRFYISLIHALMNDEIDRSDPDALLPIFIKFKTNRALSQFHDVIDILRNAFTERREDSEENAASVAARLMKATQRVKAAVIRRRVDKSTRKLFAKIQGSSGIEPDQELAALIDIREDLEGMRNLIEVDDTQVYTGTQPTGMVDFTDRKSIFAALQKRNARDCKGVIKSGWQGMNRALGEAEGIIPGESLCHAALTHHGKSLLISKWALWGVEFNPQLPDEDGTPMVLFISNENEEYRNMMDIFKMKYTEVEGRAPKRMNDVDIENWIVDFFGKHETKFVIERYAEDFGFKEYKERLAYWRSLKYKIVMVCLDYLSNMKLFSDDKQASRGSRENGLREVSHQLVNDARIGGYAFITGHQLNRKAEEIAEINTMPVKKFNLNCLQDSSSIHREFDIMHYQYMEVVQSSQIKYFEGYVPKHRHVVTPEAHKFYAYPLLPGVGIKDDLGGAPGFVMDPYVADFAANEDFDSANKASVGDAF